MTPMAITDNTTSQAEHRFLHSLQQVGIRLANQPRAIGYVRYILSLAKSGYLTMVVDSKDDVQWFLDDKTQLINASSACVAAATTYSAAVGPVAIQYILRDRRNISLVLQL